MINTFLWIIVLLATASVALFLIPAHQPKTIDEKRTLKTVFAEWRLDSAGWLASNGIASVAMKQELIHVYCYIHAQFVPSEHRKRLFLIK